MPPSPSPTPLALNETTPFVLHLPPLLPSPCSAFSQVDVEGYEPQVLMSASGLLRDRSRITNILLEYSPGLDNCESRGSLGQPRVCGNCGKGYRIATGQVNTEPW